MDWGLYYNEDLFATAGVTPNTTWPELLDIVPKLTVKFDTQIQKSAIALGTTGNVEILAISSLLFYAKGAKLLTPTERGRRYATFTAKIFYIACCTNAIADFCYLCIEFYC